MPNQHRWPQRSLRLPTPLWERAKAFAGRKGTTPTSVTADALTEYLDRHEKPEEKP
jgi:hypothetical protein